MRIIAGQHRGRPLKTPKGDGTRPTTDRVKEALMSCVISRKGSFDGLYVLDAFAGSGSLGLEALSRGAAFAQFCERDRRAAVVVEANIDTLGFGPESARLVRGDVFTGALRMAHPADVVFLDPPYDTDPASVAQLLDKLRRAGSLADDVLITYEHRACDDAAVDAAFAGTAFATADRRRWGETAIDFITREDSQ